MKVLQVRNVHAALPEGLELLAQVGLRRDSRNGPVIQHPGPVATVYERPMERVMFHPWREANPFFHFYESLWMLAGRRDVKPLVRYVKRMGTYSDDGDFLNAAYGYRWRHIQSYSFADGNSTRDQLTTIIEGLKKNPECRRQVLQIWDHNRDLGVFTKDAACNLMATFQVSDEGALDMVVFCRSNDMIMGAYGANAVHFSFLQEYIAHNIDQDIGTYTQISVNFHAYVGEFDKFLEKARLHAGLDAMALAHGGRLSDDKRPIEPMGLDAIEWMNPYSDPDGALAFPIMGDIAQEDWDEDCQTFVTDDGRLNESASFTDKFFIDVASPIVAAHDVYKDGTDSDARFDDALSILESCAATDWRRACTEWIRRRQMDAKVKKEYGQ